MSLLFGKSHPYFGEQFFKYLTNGSLCQRVTLKMILKKFKLMFPKKNTEDVDE